MSLKFRLFGFLSRNTLSRKHDVGILFTWGLVWIYLENCEFICVQLVSEEHDESTAPSGHIGPLSGLTSMELTKEAERVQKNDITIWIDPLDATQEYTGTTYCSLKPTIETTFIRKAHENAV